MGADVLGAEAGQSEEQGPHRPPDPDLHPITGHNNIDPHRRWAPNSPTPRPPRAGPPPVEPHIHPRLTSLGVGANVVAS